MAGVGSGDSSTARPDGRIEHGRAAVPLERGDQHGHKNGGCMLAAVTGTVS